MWIFPLSGLASIGCVGGGSARFGAASPGRGGVRLGTVPGAPAWASWCLAAGRFRCEPGARGVLHVPAGLGRGLGLVARDDSFSLSRAADNLGR